MTVYTAAIQVLMNSTVLTIKVDFRSVETVKFCHSDDGGDGDDHVN